MSETRFSLRRPNPDQAADVESYIDHGTAVSPAEDETVPEETPEKIRRLVILLPNNTHRQFKQMAVAQDTTMSDICRTWIEEALENYFD